MILVIMIGPELVIRYVDQQQATTADTQPDQREGGGREGVFRIASEEESAAGYESESAEHRTLNE